MSATPRAQSSRTKPQSATTTPMPMLSSYRPSPKPPLSVNYGVNTPSPGSPVFSQPSLKIKSGISSEARTRLMVKPQGVRPIPSPSRRIEENAGEGSVIRGMAIVPTPAPAAEVYEDAMIEEEDGELELPQKGDNVLVTVRIRPPNRAEAYDHEPWTYLPDGQSVQLGAGRDKKEWTFDRILEPETSNAQVYESSARTHVRAAMQGYNAVVFAYGQTASGKTYTLSGSDQDQGIIGRSIHEIFRHVSRDSSREYLLRASYLELYNETLHDLLSPNGLGEVSIQQGKKDGEVKLHGLTEMAIRNPAEVRALLAKGEEMRKVGCTDWNSRSSRSHCVFRVVIESRLRSVEDEVAGTPKRKGTATRATRISCLSIIDLAGSEKATTSKDRNIEGKYINQSLLTLKLVISKLGESALRRVPGHIPYRDSKLTRLLQPSLSGDALISVICTLSPSAGAVSESSSTLAFAQGIKRVVLRASKKEIIDPDALIQQYQNEIAELKAALAMKEADVSGGRRVSAVERKENLKAEMRYKELKSLILTAGTLGKESRDETNARCVSPTKLTQDPLPYDQSDSELQEALHNAQVQVKEQAALIESLQRELSIRPADPNAECRKLVEQNAMLQFMVDENERNLLEPSRKVREDVEREWFIKVQRVTDALESKTIWANRLDENVRSYRRRNLELEEDLAKSRARVEEFDGQLQQILAFVTGLDPDEDGALSEIEEVPSVVVSAPDDFGPSASTQGGFDTLGAMSKLSKARMSQMDLARFTSKFGSISKTRMIRDDSSFDLAMRETDEAY